MYQGYDLLKKVYNFFKTTCNGAPDVSDTITWQMLTVLGHTNEILSQVSAPTLQSPNYGLSQSDSDVPLDNYSITSTEANINWDTHSVSEEIWPWGGSRRLGSRTDRG